MASEKMARANRRNASRSTGPRTAQGKARARSNARRHGLSIGIAASHEGAAAVEELARKLVAGSDDSGAMYWGRSAAAARLGLLRVREAKVQLIRRAAALGTLLPAKAPLDIMGDPLASMPLDDREREAEALRRALPELGRFDRYERRALSRWNTAMRRLPKLGQVAVRT